MTDFANATWRKSSRSQNNGACVEIATVGNLIGIRDSKNPTGPALVFTTDQFAAFIDATARGELNTSIGLQPRFGSHAR